MAGGGGGGGGGITRGASFLTRGNANGADRNAGDGTSQRTEIHVSIRIWGPSLSPFAVVYDERRRALRARSRAEIGRTETITHAGSGACRTFLRSFVVRTSRSPNLRVSLFDFVKSSTLVEDHVPLGAVTFSLQEVLATGVKTLKISAPVNARNQVAVILRASKIDDALYAARRSVVLRIVVPEMRRRKFPHQLVTQSFDVSRCATSADPSAGPSWVPVYRSEAVSSPEACEKHVRFDVAIIPEWRLYGSVTPLRIRLLQHSLRSVRVSVAAVCTTSLQELQELDPARDALFLFGARNTSTSVGRLFLTQAEPTESGGVFSLTAQYNQFSISGAKRALSLSMTRMALRSDRKYSDRRPDDSSFGSSREPPSTGSGRSLDRFALKLRKHKISSDSNWATTSAYEMLAPASMPAHGTPNAHHAHARGNLNARSHPHGYSHATQPKSPSRWRSWLSPQ